MSQLRKVTITASATDVSRIWDAIREDHRDQIGDTSSMTVNGSQGTLELLTSVPEVIASMQLVRLLGAKVTVADV